MKKYTAVQALPKASALLAIALLALTTVFINACGVKAVQASPFGDEAPHKLVIQMNKDDKKLQSEVITNAVNTQKYFGPDDVQVEIVVYGPGIYFITTDSIFKPRIESLMMSGVVFTACAETLETIEKKTGKKLELINGVKTVSNGVPHIMELQEKGYSYLSP
jgi:intracellular sulfur oxidation DsrE/DsrF family protein